MPVQCWEWAGRLELRLFAMNVVLVPTAYGHIRPKGLSFLVMSPTDLWKRFQKYACRVESLGLTLDISRMPFDDAYLDRMGPPMAAALEAMERLERGAVANPDEKRMVGHYWLRTPRLAPLPEIQEQIRSAVVAVSQFAWDVHMGTVAPQRGDGFFVVLVIGIGGSALGPQFVCDALSTTGDPMMVRFLDNTDPDGIDRVLAEIDDSLEQTLTVVISKSGGTIETRNAMLEVAAAYRRAGLDFARHAVAVTCEDSELHRKADEERWLRVFPMWDWVGGRTSVLSPAGLLPIALQGAEVEPLLAGARECDAVSRNKNIGENPAALLALMWHAAGEGRGRRNMVVLPYRDRLALLGRYLQQLIMESLGKELDRQGHAVHQGLTVFGNKGSTDQHAYVQQLRDGPDDFFVTFIEVLKDRQGPSFEVEEGVSCGDYLHGFLYGTRAALTERGRASLTITLDVLNAHALGTLIALFERAVGLYAELINLNAYHQPGVEAGKKAASGLIGLKRLVLRFLVEHPVAWGLEELAQRIQRADELEAVYHILEHAAANPDSGVVKERGTTVWNARYRFLGPM